MAETVSASHFRVHFKEIANSIARGGEPITVARHGFEMVALVSLEDLEFSGSTSTERLPRRSRSSSRTRSS